jgi:hypothetical protein
MTPSDNSIDLIEVLRPASMDNWLRDHGTAEIHTRPELC